MFELLMDAYELTMARSYLENGMTGDAVFEYFVRRLPENRSFLISAGLEQAVEFLEQFHFSDEDLQWLSLDPRFNAPPLLNYLSKLRFTGNVDAVPEGTPIFANEPLIRVVAPLPVAQLIETRLMNIIHFETMIASKAARTVLIAPEKQLVDFGVRRAHGSEAGLLAARASYLAGFDGTSTLLAGRKYGIPTYGTMAHSFVEAHRSELDSFRNFAKTFPGTAVLLLDTYDTEAAARAITRAYAGWRREGIRFAGVRIDSGDLLQHSKNIRHILDEAGLKQVQIFASGSLDETIVQRLLIEGAPIDGFGVGTMLTTSGDAPYLDSAYKIQEYEGRPTFKLSEGKVTLPGRKQVFRFRNDDGTIRFDVIGLEGEEPPTDTEPLLLPAMRNGKRITPVLPLSQIRGSTLRNLADLPMSLRRLTHAIHPYPVEISPALLNLSQTARMAAA